jgi:hypothetical protein
MSAPTSRQQANGWEPSSNGFFDWDAPKGTAFEEEEATSHQAGELPFESLHSWKLGSDSGGLSQVHWPF